MPDSILGELVFAGVHEVKRFVHREATLLFFWRDRSVRVKKEDKSASWLQVLGSEFEKPRVNLVNVETRTVLYFDTF